MRSLLLAGLMGVLLGLSPRPGSADQVSEIFLDFPELAEWGRPVSIGGYEYWQPHPAYLPAGWEPYTNGYLYEDPTDGLTWVSQDPWGFITEHYGYWRHHEVYGFVWRPLYPIEWRPYVASLFRDGSDHIVGWCPFYYDAWNHGYYLIGFGFDDYYWGAFWGRVHYADFYPHHWWRFRGYYVSVTIYDYGRHHRNVPGPCHRRDRDYRQRRDREPPRHGRNHDLAVRSSLPARPAEAATVHRGSPADAPAPSRPARHVEVPAREVKVASPQRDLPSRAVSTPSTPAPARQSSVAQERKERMQLLRDRMQSRQAPSVSPQRPSRRTASAGVSAPTRAPQATRPALPRGNLEARRPSSASAVLPSPSLSPSRPAVRTRSAAPAARPAALRVESRPQARVERAREALTVQRRARNK